MGFPIVFDPSDQLAVPEVQPQLRLSGITVFNRKDEIQFSVMVIIMIVCSHIIPVEELHLRINNTNRGVAVPVCTCRICVCFVSQ